MPKRLLTKSRFKLALECPNKLYYTKKEEYANQQLEEAFLQALAEGRFQVEELARLEYPERILIKNILYLNLNFPTRYSNHYQSIN